MTELETRSYSALEVREADNGEHWEISGIAVPWGQPVRIGKYREQFVRGAFDGYDGGALLYSQHDHLRGKLPIGRVVEAEDTEAGWFVRAKISATDKGREIYQLVKDGVLKSLSVGFAPIESENRDGIVTRTRAIFREVSVVGMPAYAGASITAVRSAPIPPEATSGTTTERSAMDNEIIEVRQSVEDLARRFDVLETSSGASVEPTLRFRSLGHFLKEVYAGNVQQAEVADMHRALTNVANTGDAGGQRPGWVQRDIKMLAEKRPVLEFFVKEKLPETGLTVTYPQFSSRTGDVAKQALETDDLPYLELVVNTASANVETYGAYSTLSRQVIERQDEAYVNKVLEAQRNSYAKITNGVVRTLLATSPGSYNVATPLPALASQNTAKPWIDSALSGMSLIATASQGLTADAWIMPFSVYTKLIGVYDTTGRPVFAVNGDGANTVGTADLRNFGATVAGLPVLVDFGMSGTDTFIVSSEAVSVLEDGAKALQDLNVVNLSNTFSIYGYLALTKNDVKGISRVVVPAV